MKHVLAIVFLFHIQLYADNSTSNEGQFNCIESLSTTQFFTGLGVGTLMTIGGLIGGSFLAERLFEGDIGKVIFITGATGGISGLVGVFGTWKLFCDGNRKKYVAVKISPNAIGGQWVLSF